MADQLTKKTEQLKTLLDKIVELESKVEEGNRLSQEIARRRMPEYRAKSVRDWLLSDQACERMYREKVSAENQCTYMRDRIEKEIEELDYIIPYRLYIEFDGWVIMFEFDAEIGRNVYTAKRVDEFEED